METKQNTRYLGFLSVFARPLLPSNTLSLPLSPSPAWSAWLILMGRPLFVNVPSCVHHCGLSIIAGLWGSFSIWHHIWHSAASINVVIILIFMSSGFTPFLSSLPLQHPPPPPPSYPPTVADSFDSSNRLSSIPENLRQPGL